MSGIGLSGRTFTAGFCGRSIPTGRAATRFPWRHKFDISRNIVDNAGAMA
jgi:hypothetical protein